MFEILSGGIFGSLIGGIFRLAPEVLKYLDKGSERTHELAMFQEQCKLCLLYTSPSPRDRQKSRMPSSA